MIKEDFENIINEQSNLKNLPNTTLSNFMDLLSNDFISFIFSIASILNPYAPPLFDYPFK